MSGISTGVGLISGINTADLINQLMALEARPVDLLRARMNSLDAQKTAFLELSARLIASQAHVKPFQNETFFKIFSAASTNEAVIQATPGTDAVPGAFRFRVHSLVTTHQIISRGFADSNKTPVGGGAIAIESAQAKVAPTTPLSSLNGGQGVRRGSIEIIDRAGNKAVVDLSFAVTVEDVLQAINDAEGIDIRARATSLEEGSASGDRIILEDLSGKTLSNLVVRDLNNGHIAEDLGLAGSVAAARLDGRDLVRLTESTPLSLLNDGNGIGRLFKGDDLIFDVSGATVNQFKVSLTDVLDPNTPLEALNQGHGVRLGVIRITDRLGHATDVDLNGATTVQEVLSRINGSGAKVSATVINSHLQITDASGAKNAEISPFIIEDVSGEAAADLGIEANTEEEAISGSDVYGVNTLGDVIRAINLNPDNQQQGYVHAVISEDGNGIRLETSGVEWEVKVSAGELDGRVSTAARDLGIEGTVTQSEPLESAPLLAGLNTVLLKNLAGGKGIDVGQVRFRNKAAIETVVDLTGARTLADVADRINQASVENPDLRITASINAAGHGLLIEDGSGGRGPLIIEDVSGAAAEQLGIALDAQSGRDVERVDGGNLQRRYITENSALSNLGGGPRIPEGKFSVKLSDGTQFLVELSAIDQTVGDVIHRINRAGGDKISARINDTGDGIVVEDKTTGGLKFEISDFEDDRTATALRIAGAAKEGEKTIDGTFEVRVDIAASDTLEDVQRKLNESGAGVTANIVDSGSGLFSKSLTISSGVSGTAGELVLDAGALDLGLSTLVRPQDAVVTFGGGSGGDGVLITSSSNTIEDAIPGVSLELLDVSEEEVTVTIAQDVDGIVEKISAFVGDFNAVQDLISERIRFNPETLERGILFGDSTVSAIRNRLNDMIFKRFDQASAEFAALSNIGLSIGADSQLTFDEERFREVYEESPEEIERLFAADETGLGDVFADVIDGLAGDEEGLVSQRTQTLDDQKELLQNRVDGYSKVLAAKRARLERQFAGLESALAQLQRQQNALAQLQALVASA